MTTFSLGPARWLCYDHSDALVLDLRENRYWAAPGAEAAGEDGALSILLRKSSDGCESFALKRHERSPAHAAIEILRRPRPRLARMDWADFAAACAIASIDLKRGRLDRSLRRLSRQRATCADERPLQTVAERIERFVAMRPWWPRPRKCLFDSVALAEFLARRGVAAELVFGVRSRPFAAHCWLERGGVVLNDALDRVLSYRPIAWS